MKTNITEIQDFQEYRMVKTSKNMGVFEDNTPQTVVLRNIPKLGDSVCGFVRQWRSFTTSPIEEINPIENGFEIKTKNSIYQFFK